MEMWVSFFEILPLIDKRTTFILFCFITIILIFFAAMTSENEIFNHFADPSSTNVFIW